MGSDTRCEKCDGTGINPLTNERCFPCKGRGLLGLTDTAGLIALLAKSRAMLHGEAYPADGGGWRCWSCGQWRSDDEKVCNYKSTCSLIRHLADALETVITATAPVCDLVPSMEAIMRAVEGYGHAKFNFGFSQCESGFHANWCAETLGLVRAAIEAQARALADATRRANVAEDEVARLREALAFYGDINTWRPAADCEEAETNSTAEIDHGQVARAALAATAGGEEER